MSAQAKQLWVANCLGMGATQSASGGAHLHSSKRRVCFLCHACTPGDLAHFSEQTYIISPTPPSPISSSTQRPAPPTSGGRTPDRLGKNAAADKSAPEALMACVTTPPTHVRSFEQLKLDPTAGSILIGEGNLIAGQRKESFCVGVINVTWEASVIFQPACMLQGK
jgi:hypothetical protein